LSVSRNLVANYTSRIWSGVATFIFLPAYIRLLGQESFGLITFATTVLGVVFVLDMGLSSAFARETARGGSPDDRAALLRSLEWVYGTVCGLGIIIGLALAVPLAETWLNPATLSSQRVAICLAMMIPAAFLQLWMALYLGGLLGAERHVLAAQFQIGFSAVRSGLVLVPLYFVPEVELVFAWQLIVSLIALWWLRRTAWRPIAFTQQPRFSQAELNKIRGFAGGMFLIAIIAAVNTQSDKLVVSKLFSLEELGTYTLASLMGQIPSLISLPIAVTILPRLTRFAASGSQDALSELFLVYSLAIGALSILSGLTIFLAAEALLELVVGQPVSGEVVAVCQVLAVGGVFLAAQYMPYHLALAYGHTRTNVVAGLIAAVLVPVAMVWGSLQFGLLGAAMPWLAMNIIATAILAMSIIPRFLGPRVLHFAVLALLLPGCVSVATLLPAQYFFSPYDGAFTRLFKILPFVLLASTAHLVIFRRMTKSHAATEVPNGTTK
jgi:O-antigen/teichoic acid export membrane protein